MRTFGTSPFLLFPSSFLHFIFLIAFGISFFFLFDNKESLTYPFYGLGNDYSSFYFSVNHLFLE